MVPETRRRSRSRSNATDRSKSRAASKEDRAKRDRAESAGEVSVVSTASKKEEQQKQPEEKQGKVDDTTGEGMEGVETIDIETKPEDTKVEPPQKSAPTMDVLVHRIRCLRYHPKAILAMKATPSWSDYSLLALSRDNGHVEVKSVGDKLRTIGFWAGYRERPVTALAWVRNPADDEGKPLLVGASKDGSIFVPNFAKQASTNLTASGGGGIFALESLSLVPGCDTCVATGCEDGSVRIFELQENASFRLISTIPSCGAPVLSLAWRKRDPTEEGLVGMSMFVAVADGTIRRFDYASQNERMAWKSVNRMTVESRGRNIPTRVWALRALQDGTLISANSLGQVQFWDSETGSLSQSIQQTDTKADVLSLAVNTDESKVFASGVDSRVVCVERRLGPEPSAWMLTQAQRAHTHDVKSLEICRHKHSELLVSGGIDTKLSTYNVAKYHTERPKIIYPWPTVSPICMASKARIVGITRENRVEMFQLADKQDISKPVSVGEKEVPLGTVEICHASNLVCVDINSQGEYLAVANMTSFYLFSLSFDKKGKFQTKRVSIGDDLSSPVSAIKFTNDNTLAVACVDGSFHVISLTKESSDRHTKDHIKRTSETRDFPVHRIVSSVSGSLIATHANSLRGGVVEVYCVKEDGSVSPLWTLPSLDKSICDISFVDEDRLAVACVDFSLLVFDVKQHRLNSWNVNAGTAAEFPPELKHRRDHPTRLVCHPGSENKLLMGSFGTFVVFDLDHPFPTACRCFPDTHVRGKKRKRSMSVSEKSTVEMAAESTASLCFLYNSMLYLDFVDQSEMVIVEQPWISILETLPSALARRVYGTGT